MTQAVQPRHQLRLTPAQRSAIECREPDTKEEPVLTRTWQGNTLRFNPDDIEGLVKELTEAANAEDAQAEEDVDPEMVSYARAACRSLTAVALRVAKCRELS